MGARWAHWSRQPRFPLLPFHIGSNDGPIWADDDAGLSLLSLHPWCTLDAW